MMPDTAPLLKSTAEMLDYLGKLTGDGRFRQARGILQGRPIGRRVIDDEQALEMAASLVDAGLAKSKNAACIRAAKHYAPPWGVNAMRARLMRKYAQNS
jgi:hypothetical protein